MTDLLTEVVESHGGSRRWSEVTGLRTELSIYGIFWGLKGWPSTKSHLDHIVCEIDTRNQHSTLFPFTEPGLRAVLDTPARLRIETADGHTLEHRDHPRDSFAGHIIETPWDRLHLAYFLNYALWNYFTTPFMLNYPGVETREIEPWDEDGETWRRLQVSFPRSIATHSSPAVFYFDENFKQRRYDYAPDVMANPPAAHYTDEIRVFDGIEFPTRRRVYLKDPRTNLRQLDRHIITCDVLSVELS